MNQDTQRQCGDCSLCCLVTRVPELDKPENTMCMNRGMDAGCSIYRERPDSCKNFSCQWLLGDMPEDLKPSLSHIVIEDLPTVPIVLAMFEPGYEQSLINNEQVLREAYVNKGIAVIAVNGYGLVPEGMSIEQIRMDVYAAAKELRG